MHDRNTAIQRRNVAWDADGVGTCNSMARAETWGGGGLGARTVGWWRDAFFYGGTRWLQQNTITGNRRKVPSIWKSGRQVCIRFQFDHVSPMDSEWPTHSYNPIFRKIYLKIIRCDVRLVHQVTLSWQIFVAHRHSPTKLRDMGYRDRCWLKGERL